MKFTEAGIGAAPDVAILHYPLLRHRWCSDVLARGGVSPSRKRGMATRRLQYRPPDETEQTNQGRWPPRWHEVQVIGTRCSTD